MINTLFIAKWVFRVGHVYPVAALTGKVFFDYLFGSDFNSSSAEKGVIIALGVILIVSGLINMILLRPKENFPTGAKFWKYMMMLKFFVTIFVLTPFLSSVTGISKKSLNTVQFYILTIFFVLSAFLRFYREHHAALRQKQLLSK
ncbi:transmembrane protein, putative (macronuclear) [Tetrahymena thermophila SB210]|uniref:Transmembrane protein, putative n=1 Tax=Tetrahymena thermophila (strain SB210) TaxID=312017 RepID=I7M0Z9_TETTS|nr:transmembrane protein, putative [Tetrahymena thermophila SB210]EAR93750.1 transmembrane protein, putative [Tetrahymena thermophila SB210]|eukprot:XP_001013995.1 transmembrane protein, putative [Tetrahymena thermophila SB210]